METTTLTLDQIAKAIETAIDAMRDFAECQGLDQLIDDGLPTLWNDIDGTEYEVNVGPTIETTVHDEIGDPIAKIIGDLEFDGSINHVTLDVYVDVPDDFTIKL